MQSLWMLLACAMFSIMGACIKVASDQGASLPQIVLFRGLPSVLLLLIWARISHRRIRPNDWTAHIWRNVAGLGSMWLFFYALSQLALSTAVSLNYTSALFITGWVLFRGNRDALRTFAVALGFLGVIAVLRPSVGQDDFLAGLLGLVGASLNAVAMMQVRQLSRIGEAEWRIVLIFSICVCLSSLGGLVFRGWSPLSAPAWVALIGLGTSGLFGQLAMTRAFGHGSTLLTVALQYANIVFATLLGIIFWGDYPDVLAWSGMALIIGAGLLSAWSTYSDSKAAQRAAQAS